MEYIKSKKDLIYLLITVLLLLIYQNSFAQNSLPLCSDFVFTRELQKGSIGQDVLILQKILNEDIRTEISKTGPGSKGKETKIFGEKTREALKKFQALFLEKVFVADGKLNLKTRELVNSICQGSLSLNQTTNTEDLQIFLSGPESIYRNETLSIEIKSNKNIAQPATNSIFMFGGEILNLVKKDQKTFLLNTKPNASTSDKQINIQIEAGKIADTSGVKNQYASNELLIEILEPVASTSTSTATNSIDIISTTTNQAILNTILKIIDTMPKATTSDCSDVVSIAVNDYKNPCYGKSPITNVSSRSNIAQMLTGFLHTLGIIKFTGNLENVKSTFGIDSNIVLTSIMDVGGFGAVEGTCACEGPNFGAKTISLVSFFGPSGRFLKDLNPGYKGGPYTGKVVLVPSSIIGTCGNFMENKKCNNPLFDSTNSGPVVGIIPATPLFIGSY